MTSPSQSNPLDAFWAGRLKTATTELHFDQPEIVAAFKELSLDQIKAVRILLEGSYCAGYYHDGYTHDSAYSGMKATECADEMLQYAGLHPTLVDISKSDTGPHEHDRTSDRFDAVVSGAIRKVTGFPDLLAGELSLKTELNIAIAGLYSQAAHAAKLNEDYDAVLRGLAFTLSAGGYNSDGLIDPARAD
jgi:hypothetical protein